MPTYEYVCTVCLERTEVKATIVEKESGLKVACPRCGSQKIAQIFGNFSVMGSSKGRSNPPMCGPQAGPGCCG